MRLIRQAVLDKRHGIDRGNALVRVEPRSITKNEVTTASPPAGRRYSFLAPLGMTMPRAMMPRSFEENIMHKSLLGIALALVGVPLLAQTADDIVSKYIKTVGGMEKIDAVSSLRRTGKFTGGGGFEAAVLEENKRPNKVREEFSMQGMTGVTAYDGKNGWKIEPWQGKKDPEPLGEDEMKDIIEDSDFDGPLVNYQQKGNKVEFVGMEPVEGTDAYKLKVTLKSGDVRYYYMDTDYYVPIKIETKRMVRGAEREYETSLGDYKEAGGWYLPYSIRDEREGQPEPTEEHVREDRSERAARGNAIRRAIRDGEACRCGSQEAAPHWEDGATMMKTAPIIITLFAATALAQAPVKSTPKRSPDSARATSARRR